MIMPLTLDAKKGGSACQVARNLKMRRATIWAIMHKIRDAMNDKKEEKEFLEGIVEVDETYIKGKSRANEHIKRKKEDDDENNGGSSGGDKNIILGMVERGGKIRAVKVDNTKSRYFKQRNTRKYRSRFEIGD